MRGEHDQREHVLHTSEGHALSTEVPTVASHPFLSTGRFRHEMKSPLSREADMEDVDGEDEDDFHT